MTGIHRWPLNSPLKGPVTRKMFPFDDVIIKTHKLMAWIQHQSWCDVSKTKHIEMIYKFMGHAVFPSLLFATLSFYFKFKFKCFIYPTEVHDIIYNTYKVRGFLKCSRHVVGKMANKYICKFRCHVTKLSDSSCRDENSSGGLVIEIFIYLHITDVFIQNSTKLV